MMKYINAHPHTHPHVTLRIKGKKKHVGRVCTSKRGSNKGGKKQITLKTRERKKKKKFLSSSFEEKSEERQDVWSEDAKRREKTDWSERCVGRDCK